MISTTVSFIPHEIYWDIYHLEMNVDDTFGWIDLQKYRTYDLRNALAHKKQNMIHANWFNFRSKYVALEIYLNIKFLLFLW